MRQYYIFLACNERPRRRDSPCDRNVVQKTQDTTFSYQR